MESLLNAHISKIHDAFDARKISPSELTQAFLQAIEKSTHNAVLKTCEKRALLQAQTADSVFLKYGKVPRETFPLFGIPIGIKDLLTIEGIETTCGSKILRDYIPPYTATSVERLEARGAISIAKLNMDEFAMGSSNENSAFGSVDHPTHPDRVPGGSSGGSGTAVRAGLCVGALGTDTGGSIRLPAAFCGVVGLKPTYGRVSRYGLVAFASSLDQIGPMTRTVEDTAIFLECLSGHDPKDSTSSLQESPRWVSSLRTAKRSELKNLKIGIPKEYFSAGISPEVQSKIQEALTWFQSQGAELVEISLPHSHLAIAAYYIIAVSEASSNLARFDAIRFGKRSQAVEQATDLNTFYKSARSEFGPEVKRRILLGTFALSSGYADAYYLQACKARRLIRNDFDQAFAQVDVICSPVSPTTAFKKGEKASDPLQMYLMDVCTIPASLAGVPALSVPCGKDSQGLPVGLQLIGPHFEEERLLKAAHLFERRGDSDGR